MQNIDSSKFRLSNNEEVQQSQRVFSQYKQALQLLRQIVIQI